MKTLRKRNITHKNRNGNRKSRNQRGNKRKTQKGGLFGFSGKEQRAKVETTGGIQSTMIELFHQLMKTYMKFKLRGNNFTLPKMKDHYKSLEKTFAGLNYEIQNDLQMICKHYESVYNLPEVLGQKNFNRIQGIVGDVQRGGKPEAPYYEPHVSVTKRVTAIEGSHEKQVIADQPTIASIPTPTQTLKPEFAKLSPEELKQVKVKQSEKTSDDQITTNIKKYTTYLSEIDIAKHPHDIFLKDEFIDNTVLSKILIPSRRAQYILTTFEEKKKRIITLCLCFGYFIKNGTGVNTASVFGQDGFKPTWTFTRHGPSCNNLISDFSAGVGLVAKKVSESYKHKTMEPSIADGGINRLIMFKGQNYDRFNPTDNFIFVSSLIRTWMTAIILYGIKKHEQGPKKTLKLVISPFLKEHYKLYLKSGNFPESVDKQVTKIINFLNYLNAKLPGQFQLPDNIELLFPNSGAFLTHNIDLTNRDPKTEKIKYNPPSEDIKNFYKLDEPLVDKASSAKVFARIDAKRQFSRDWYHELNYAYDGDIVDFVNWISIHKQKLIDAGAVNLKTSVNVVAHSNLMKSGVQSIDRVLGKTKMYDYGNKEGEDKKSIFDTNAWTLIIPASDVTKINPTQHMIKGIPKKDKKSDPTWTESTLCNTKGAAKADAAKAAASTVMMNKESDERFKRQVDDLKNSANKLASYANEKGEI